MNKSVFVEYFILGLPFAMAAIFCAGLVMRWLIWYTVRRHEWFARQFEIRVTRYVDSQTPGANATPVSFYLLTKRLLERTYYESFALRDRLQRRRGDRVMSLGDRMFLVKPGCAWMVRSLLKHMKFLRWTNETPKLMHITRQTLDTNPAFSRVFGLIPIAGVNDLLNLLPGLFVIAGILGTFVGIAGGLQELGGMNLTDLDNTRNIMDRFLHEIAFAMRTSIAGIVFSLVAHVFNTWFSPDRVYSGMVESLEGSLDLLWYRSDNNLFPVDDKSFDEHRDPIEALAEEAVNAEMARLRHDRGLEPGAKESNPNPKAS